MLNSILQTRAGFTVVAIFAAFGAYTCMYAFRRPFTVGDFGTLQFAGVDYKIWLIIAQVLGYTTSKFLGILIISEMQPARRAISLLVLIALAEASLALFYAVRPPLNIVFLFLNGLPLGMVWGIVFSFLEGRRNTELLGAGLCVTFIISSAIVKSAGSWLMVRFDIDSFAMPALTGLLFFPLLLLCTWLLYRLPAQNSEDKSERVERVPMSRETRLRVWRDFGWGLAILILFYALLTAYRDLRDNFAKEIWDSLGYAKTPGIFTVTEIPVTVGVLVLLGSLIFIHNNRTAFRMNLFIVLGGALLIAISTFLVQRQLISGPAWMIAAGLGSYAAYIPFNAMLFERMIASFRIVGNAGFLIYLADSFGYLSSTGVLIIKNFAHPQLSWLAFLQWFGYILAAVALGSIVFALLFFERKHRRTP
ncbi:MAG: hypothetical protein J0L53_08710 [Spirochaetes bacterium]|nr:hypothetical protein [Spirochaetota bacterium]